MASSMAMLFGVFMIHIQLVGGDVRVITNPTINPNLWLFTKISVWW
jgi:hypothetical protein